MKEKNCVSNISAWKYLSKMVQNSKRTFENYILNETDPNYLRFVFQEKLGKTMHEIIIWKHFWTLNTMFFAQLLQ